MVARVLSPEIPTMPPPPGGAGGNHSGGGGIQGGGGRDTEGKTLLIINSSNKAIDLVSRVCVCALASACDNYFIFSFNTL